MSGRDAQAANYMSRSHDVTTAAIKTELKSKRISLIDKEVQNLNRTLGDLEEGTKSRNRIFQKQIDDVWDCSEIWEAKLRTESREAVESITNLREEYEKHVEDFSSSVLNDLRAALDKIDNELISPVFKRYDKAVEEMDTLSLQECPVAINKTTGEITRAAAKMKEYFSVRQQKEHIREQKFVRNSNEHIQATAQHLSDEDSLTMACFANLLDETIEVERRSSRLHSNRHSNAVKNVLEVKNELEIEANIRLKQDSVLLDTIIESQRMLQQTVLEHFGLEVDKMELNDNNTQSETATEEEKNSEKDSEKTKKELKTVSAPSSEKGTEKVVEKMVKKKSLKKEKPI